MKKISILLAHAYRAHPITFGLGLLSVTATLTFAMGVSLSQTPVLSDHGRAGEPIILSLPAAPLPVTLETLPLHSAAPELPVRLPEPPSVEPPISLERVPMPRLVPQLPPEPITMPLIAAEPTIPENKTPQPTPPPSPLEEEASPPPPLPVEPPTEPAAPAPPAPPPAPTPVQPTTEENAPTESSAIQSPMDTTKFRASLPDEFPALQYTLHPVAEVPNWGAMTTPAQWNRTYGQMTEEDFVPIPRYDLTVLTTPLKELTSNRTPENIAKITAKLYYSTRFFGVYDLDAGEFVGIHPGLDLKLARGTPIGAIAGGRVHDVRSDDIYGLHVLIEHRIPEEGTFYSIYGHLETASVRRGDDLRPGEMIGTVGTSGRSSVHHLHLQVDRAVSGEVSHTNYAPATPPSPAEADRWTVHPITFLAEHRRK